eukprot:TRINITY_DN1632_c0_g1_i1.p1 TRINITY_DN1632_c0_g1~~TRINITY_DN1632_c0_g1_i1.p1  ORF type:complete len:586 (-),score=154.28 TRINITY_DN1632_c0_g1_i1:68-1615(-)
MIVGLVEQLSQIHQKDTETVIQEMCSWIPDKDIQGECDYLAETFGPILTYLLDEAETPDRACDQIGFCSNVTCHLFPAPISPRTPTDKFRHLGQNLVRPNHLPSWEWPWDKINEHKPVIDIDGDLFSTIMGLRGYAFRGADCNDTAADIYPGRAQSDYPDTIDHDCNGIYGHDANGQSYEELLCSGTQRMAAIILGDSAGAHFHIPPQWITAADMNKTIYSNLIEIAENELDWPMMSSATGYMTSTWQGAPQGPLDSGYLRNFNKNRCAMRDYQNIAVNGARSSSMLNIMKTLARNQTTDHPAFVSYALIGNDVCNGHYGMRHMTTPEEFYSNVVSALEFLDTVLPKGSHVGAVGLVDGRILYNTMGNRIHPIGSTDKNVKYSNFYDFLNCLGISPCFGWMNSDEYWRDATSARAAELNQVYKNIVSNHTWNNFDFHYFDCPLEKVLNIWESKGGQAWQLIEPVDGFHPTQESDYLAVQVLEDQYEAVGITVPSNPMNSRIQQIFGDQGGYFPKN